MFFQNTVTLYLDGDREEPLNSYRRSQGHYRAWNRSRGIRVDVSHVYGGQREVYTTPSAGTFYYAVQYNGRKLTFVIQGRRWLASRFLWSERYLSAEVGGPEDALHEQK